MIVTCPRCGDGQDLDQASAGKTVRCPGCGKSFVAPAELAITGRKHTLGHMPVATVVLLHFVSAGLFSIIYLNLLHDRMPRLRRWDPTATVALGLCFVPIVNFVWIIFSFHRLCARINEQRSFKDLSPAAPEWLAVATGLILACGGLATWFTPQIGLWVLGALGLVVLPIFAALVQYAVNGISEEQPTEPLTI